MSNEMLILTAGERLVGECRASGFANVLDMNEYSPEDFVTHDNYLHPRLDGFEKFTIVIPPGGESLRDAIAIRLGDDRCEWAYAPLQLDGLRNAILSARPMWNDEIASIDDIPEPGEEKTYETGFDGLDKHGFRITLPAFMPVIGPYGSGKSVFLRQLLVNLYRKYEWRFLLTSFEERVKPRFLRDLRRHWVCSEDAIDGDGVLQWSTDAGGRIVLEPAAIARADAKIRQMARFLIRKRGTTLDLERLLDRIEFAVRAHGVKVICIDPVNEIDHVVPKGESKTDYMGKFIMKLKQLADDYGLLMIVAAHPPKDGVEKRLQKNGLLTLNDGADTAHWGNKADIGLCLWRDIDGPTLLHIDKVKDHETMGKPTLAELVLDRARNQFTVGRIGFDILRGAE
jgi:KaiC/GvpD/RAD55 family RecA-like ATPase